MNVARALSEGVAGWLAYEWHSQRGRLFNEKYLSHPIGNILSGAYGSHVRAEFNHPILVAQGRKGRPPQLDFVILDEQENITTAVESKWLGRSTPDVGAVLWDLIRLELIHNDTGADCFFVLAGRIKDLEAFFASDRFQEPRVNGRKRPILRIDRKRKQSVRIDNPPPSRLKVLKPYVARYPDVSMPSAIVTGYPTRYPDEGRNTDYQVWTWRIGTYSRKPRLFPKNSKPYTG